MGLINYFVAVSFRGNGSLGFNIKTGGSEEMAKLIVLQEYLPRELLDMIEDTVVVPQYRIDVFEKKN